MTEQMLNALTEKIIGVAIDVHRELGPGMLEKVYLRCMKIALEEAGLLTQIDIGLPVRFRGKLVDSEGYRIDLLVEDTVVLMIKSVSAVPPVYEKQLQTYIRLADKPCGLLFNFNSPTLHSGIKRAKNGYLPNEINQ